MSRGAALPCLAGTVGGTEGRLVAELVAGWMRRARYTQPSPGPQHKHMTCWGAHCGHAPSLPNPTPTRSRSLLYPVCIGHPPCLPRQPPPCRRRISLCLQCSSFAAPPLPLPHAWRTRQRCSSARWASWTPSPLGDSGPMASRRLPTRTRTPSRLTSSPTARTPRRAATRASKPASGPQVRG